MQSRAGLVQHQPGQRGRLEEWGDHQCNQGFKQSSNFNSTLRRLLWQSLWDANEIEYIMFTPAQSGHQPGGADQQARGALQGCGGGDALSLCFPRLWCGPLVITIIIMITIFSSTLYCFLSDCVIRSGDAAGLPLCYEDCVALRQQVRFLILDQPHICSETAG